MVRRLLERALPPDTRRRRLAGAAVAAARDARSALRRDAHVREAQVPSAPAPCRPAGVTYREWFCRLPADPSVLEAQRQWFEEWTRPLKVWGLVLDDGGDIAATELSLRNQSWGLVEAVKVEAAGLAETFRRLSRDCPGDLAVVLRAGDRLRPDAAFKMAQAAWRDPWLELVYWDDDLAEVAEVWDWHLAGMPEGVYFDDDLDNVGQPRIKPGWSPDLLLCANYIGRAFAVRARRLQPEAALRWRDAGASATPSGGTCCWASRWRTAR